MSDGESPEPMPRIPPRTTTPARLVLGAAVACWLLSACSGAVGPSGDDAPAADPRRHSGPAWFDPEGFPAKAPTRPGDWLDLHPETGRSFRAYRRSRPPRAGRGRRVLAIQPLGPFTACDRALLRTAADFASLYFQAPVRIQPAGGLPRKDRRALPAAPGREVYWQYRTDWILRTLPARLPRDAMALLGVTMQDLYPEPSWNFVFGVASLDERVGIYSLARFRPSFRGEPDSPASRHLTLLRTLKVLAHETAHLFGLTHCVRFACVVNGSNSLEEADRTPLHLCPDCLRKLAWNRGFDHPIRYRALAGFYRRHGLPEDAAFVEGRLARAEARRRNGVAGSETRARHERPAGERIDPGTAGE